MAVTHKSYIDWNNTGALPLSATDESGYVRLAAGALVANHGRDQARAYTPPVAGQANWSFDNTTFRFSSQNTGSPLFGKINPGLLNQHTVNIPDVAAGYAQTVLNDGPFLYYRLDEIGGQAIDASGNALFGTYAGTCAPGVAGALSVEPGGWSDYAVKFTAPSGTISVPNSSLMNCGDVFTIEFWINPSASPAAAIDIVSKGTGAYQVQLDTSSKIVLRKNGTGVIATSTSALGSGAWNHVVVTKNGSTVKIYFNGTDVTGIVTNQTCVNTSTALTVAGLTGATIDVTLDEIALYSSALSSTRVSVHTLAGANQTANSDQSSTYRFHTGYLDLPKELPGIAQQMVNEQSLDGLSILKQAIISTQELVGVTIDVAVNACLDAAGWPTALRSIETAATTLNRWCVDNIDAFSAIRDLTFTEGANACFYLDPVTGKIKWENRHHRWLAQRSIVAQWTANAQGAEPIFGQEFSFDDGVRNIINSCTVPVNQYTIAALAAVWTGPASVTIAPNQSVSYTVSTIANWFTGAVTPASGTDYDVSAGSLTSVTLSRTSGKRATLTFTAGASGATVAAHSPNASIQMRAQAVTFTQVYISNSISGASTSGVNYGTKTLPTDFTPSWVPDTATATDWCNFMVSRYKDPVPIVTFNLNDVSDTRLLYAMQARISDRIHVNEPMRSFVNFDAFVEQITDTVTMGSHHTRSFGCEQAQQQAFWILGIAGYSELGTTTRLGF